MSTRSTSLLKEYLEIEPQRQKPFTGSFPLVDLNQELSQIYEQELGFWPILTFAGEIRVENGILLRRESFWVGGLYPRPEHRDEMVAEYMQNSDVWQPHPVADSCEYIFYLSSPRDLIHFVTFCMRWSPSIPEYDDWFESD